MPAPPGKRNFWFFMGFLALLTVMTMITVWMVRAYR